MRCGLHAGEVDFDAKAGSATAVLAADLVKLANANETVVTDARYDLLAGSGLRFANRGDAQGTHLYTVVRDA